MNSHHERKRERGRNRKNEDAERRVEMSCDSFRTFARDLTKAQLNARVLAKMTEWPEKNAHADKHRGLIRSARIIAVCSGR